ncbi:MAG: class I SAM-dependent methyltransferase [Treponema sp.]|nr:class I SAM-dependent methyltransferase [Treponema sp.]
MSAIQNLVEYYDELFPVTESQKKFYDELIGEYVSPVKFLNINCGTGMFENLLARSGHDVTGLEESSELIYCANLRRRNQLMAVRFFEMSYIDMTKFLCKGFYNIISCLNGRIIYIHDKNLIKKFFYDCKSLLSADGGMIISLPNFSKYKSAPMIELPLRESIRTRLFSEVWTDESGSSFIVQNVETGNGKMLPVQKDTPVYMLQPEEIEDFAKDAGFSSVDFYSDFDKKTFTGNEDYVVVKIN